MKRALVYLIIFAIAGNVAVFSLLYLSDPILEHGQSNNFLVAVFIFTCLVALWITLALVISIIKLFMPNRKLPHLLVRDSLVLAGLLSLGGTGLLVLQLLRAATVVNISLWLIIVAAAIWIVRSLQKAMNQPDSPKRAMLLSKKLKSK